CDGDDLGEAEADERAAPADPGHECAAGERAEHARDEADGSQEPAHVRKREVGIDEERPQHAGREGFASLVDHDQRDQPPCAAMPSVAMSWVAATKFNTTMAPISAGTESAIGATASAVNTSTPASCIGRIQDRLRPRRGHQLRSTIGAHTNLSAHGTASNDVNP